MKFGLILPNYAAGMSRLAVVDTAIKGTSASMSEPIKAFQQAGVNATVLGFQAETQPAREPAMRCFAVEIMTQFPG